MNDRVDVDAHGEPCHGARLERPRKTSLELLRPRLARVLVDLRVVATGQERVGERVAQERDRVAQFRRRVW